MKLNNILKSLTIIVAVIVGLYFVPPLISFNYLKPILIQKFADEAGLNVKIFGNVSITLIPNRSFVIDQVRLDVDDKSQVEIPKLVLNIDLGSLFSNDININGIELTGAQFDLATIEYLSKKGFKNEVSRSQILQSLKLNNINLVVNPSSGMIGKLNNISGDLNYIPLKSLKFKGSFDLNNFDYALNMDLTPYSESSSNISTFSLTSDFIDLSFNGNLNIEDSYDLKGKLDIKFFDKIKETADVSTLYRLLLKDEIKIQSDLTFNKNEFAINNFLLSSKNISKVLGDINYKLAENNLITTVFEGDSANFDNIFNDINSIKLGTEEAFTFENFIKDFLNNFNFEIYNDLSGTVNIKFKELILNKKPITDLSITANLINEKLVLEHMLFNLPGKTSLEFKGILGHNTIRPKFSGKMLLTVNDYAEFSNWISFAEGIFPNLANQILTIDSDISIIPRGMRFDNAQLKWANLGVAGKLAIKHNGDKRLTTAANLKVNAINANEMKLPDNVDEFIANLYAYDFEKSGSKFYEITNDFKWLRNFPIDLNLDLLIDDFAYKDLNFPSFYISSEILPNNFSIREMSINSDQISVGGAISLITSAIAPKITTNLIVDRISTDFITKIMPSNDILIAKQSEVLAQNVDAAQVVVSGGANFYGISNIIGDFKLTINDFKSPTLSAQNINLAAQCQDGIISVSDLNGNFFNGKLQLLGNIVLTSVIPTYTATFALNNFQLASLLNYYASYKSVDGYSSISGNLVTKGADYDSIYNNLAANINVLGKKITWDTFDIGEIVRLSEYKATYEEKSNKLNTFVTSGQSVFDDLKGSIVISQGMANLNDFKFNNSRVSGALAAKLDVKNHLISNFTRMSFIPFGKASVMTVDVIGSGAINNLNPSIKMDKYLKFLKDDAAISRDVQENNQIQSLLRNRKF